MILYWAWPTDGAGHAVRAAAICRWFDEEVLVIRGTDDPLINRALEYFNIPFTVIPSRNNAIKFALAHACPNLVLDDRCGTALDRKARVCLWREGRPTNTSRPLPMIRIEGPGALAPILMLESSEILSKEEAREDLGLAQDKHIAIGIPSTSRPGLIENRPEVDYLLTRWPALKWMRAADRIVSAIGANVYGEVNYLRLPVIWLTAPNARDQSVRIHSLPEIPVTENAAQKVAEIIVGLKSI